VKIATANLAYTMSAAQMLKAGRIIRRKGIGIVGFQEMREERDRTALREGLRMGWHEGDECPQAFRSRRWQVVGAPTIVHRATTGLDGVTPHLPIVRVQYADKRRPALTFVVYNTHLVPLSLHGLPRRDHSEWRRKAWDAHFSRLAEMVRADVAAGHTVFVLGDFNNIFAGDDKVRQLHPRGRWLARSGLDWVAVVEGSVRVRKVRGLSFATGSDHKAIGAQVILTVKR